MDNERRRRHIFKTGNAFLPQSRMRQIRRETDVALSQAKRDGVKDPVVRHTKCSCGSIACLGFPMILRDS